MTREDAENLLNKYIDKYETAMDYVRRDGTQSAEDNAVLEYTQLKEKLIELICGAESEDEK